MILRKNLPVGGTLITIVILLFCECHTISGQDETAVDFSSFSTTSHKDDIIEDAPCPCILKLECPRVYGSNPLDFTEIGQVEPCREDGYVRCCGIAVTVVQAQDTRYEESSTWEFSDSDAVTTSPHEEGSKTEDDAESLDHSDSSNLDSAQGQNDSEKDNDEQKEEDDENHENTEKHDDQGNSEEKKSMSDENEDLVALPSNQDSFSVIVQPPGDPSRRKFRPKFPRYQRPEKIATWTELGSNDGNNSNEKHVSEEEEKIKSSDNNSNNGNEGSGSVVYSQRVPEFSPYRRRNPFSNSAPVYTITPIDSPNDSGKEASDDSAGAITANRGDRPKYQMRRRKPFKQMRNRVQQQEQEENINGKDGSEIKPSEGETKDSVEIDGLSTPSSSLDSSSPPSLHVTTATEASSSEEITNGLDNQKRPMSRLGRPKVNGLFGRNPIGSIETSPIMSAEQNESLESNAVTSTLNNDEFQDNREVLKEREILENESTTEESSAGITGSTSESSKSYENSPTGKLMPIRPKIRAFPLRKNSTDAVNIGKDTVVSQEENKDEAVTSPVSDADDTGKPTEPLQPKRNGLRKVLVRRVRPNSSTVPSETDEGSNNVSTEDVENVPVHTASRLSRGKVIIRHIRPASSSSLQIPNVNAEEISSAPSLKAEGQDENKETPNPSDTPKEEKLDIRRKLLGRKRKNPLKETTSESPEEVEKVENPEEPVKPSESEPNRPNILKRRRLLRKPSGQGQTVSSDNNNSSEKDTKSSEDSSVVVEEVPELPVPAEKSPIKIRKGLLRKPQKNTEKEEQAKPENSPDSESASVTSAVETDKPFLLRQRHRMSASNRSKGKNPLLPSSTESTVPAEESHTSEAPVTVTSTYSRIRVNNKHGLLSRPAYRKTVKPSYPAESEKNSIAPKETSQTDTNNVSRVSKYVTRTRTRVSSTVPPPQKSEETNSTPLPEIEEKPIGSNDDVEKQGQLSQLTETSQENSGQAQDPPKRRRYQRKRVRVNKPLLEQQEKQVDQQETEQKHQQQQEKVEDNNQNEESGNDVNPTEENSEHVTSSLEVATTENYPNSDILQGNDEVIQKQEQSEDQSSPSVYSSSVSDAKYNLEGTNKVSLEEEHVGIVQNPISSSSGSEDYHQKHYLGSSISTSNVGHDGIKLDDDNNDNYDDSKDKKVFSYHPEGSRGGEIEPYDLILNQDVRKTLGTQGTHQLKPHEASADVSSDAYQVHAQDPQTLDHKQAYRENRNHASLSHHSTHILDQDERPQQPPYYTRQQYYPHNYEQDYYDPYSIDNYESQNSDDEIDKYSGEAVGYGNGYNRYHEPVIPTYAQQFSEDDDGTGGFETIEFGTPDYDPTPYNSWYSYGEGQEDEEESRISVKFLKDKSRKNESSQVLGNPKDQSIRGNGSNNNSNNKNDNEGSRVNNSEVGPPRVTHRTVNRLNISNTQENGKDRTHSLTNENAGTGSIRKDANASIRQKLRRPPSAYIRNSSDSHVERVPTTAAPFSPSSQSPRPTYSGKEAVLESVNQSAQSSYKTQEPSSSTSKSTSYPNSGQPENFPSVRKNRTRTRVKLVTFRTTTPTPAPLTSTYANSNDDYSLNENEKNVVAPDASSSSSPLSGGATQRPFSSPSSTYSSFTFPPFKKSELTLISTSTETPLEDYVSHASTDSSTSVSSLRKPQRNSYSSKHNNQATSSTSNELPKTSSQVNRHVPKPSFKGRFKAPLKNLTNNLVTSEHPTPQPHEASSSSSFESRTTKRPQPRIKSPPYIRKFSTISTTERPIRHQIPETSTATQTDYVNHSERDVEQEVTTPLSYGSSSLAPENTPEPTSIRIESQHEDLNKYNEINNGKYVNEFSAYATPESIVRESSPSPNSIHSPSFSHSFPKVSGKESYALSDSKSSTQKGKYTRFKVPQKFNLPHIEESTSIPTTSSDNYVPKEHPDQKISTFSYESENAQVSEEPFQTELHHFPTPTRTQSDSRYSPEHTLNENANLYDQQHSSHDENFQNLALPQQSTFDDEHYSTVQSEPEVIPDIRINVLPPPVLNNLQDERTTPKPLFLATREPEHFFDTPSQQPQAFTLSNALSSSPYGPFPSTDHWSGIPSANSPRLPEYFEKNKEQPQTESPPQQNSHVIFEQNPGTNLPPPSPGHTPSVSFEQSREQPQLFSPQPNSNTMFEQNREPSQLSSPPRPTFNVMFEQGREPPQLPSPSQHNAMFEQSREPSELPPPLPPTSTIRFEQNREPPHLPSPPRPTSNIRFEQNREPPHLPSPPRPTSNIRFEQNREPPHLPSPPRPTSNTRFEQNREPPHLPSPPRPTSNIRFEQNREPPHLPSPPRPTSNVFFEQGREPSQLPSPSQPTAMFEQSREPPEFQSPPRPISNIRFEQNREPPHLPSPPRPTSYTIFEQNREPPHLPSPPRPTSNVFFEQSREPPQLPSPSQPNAMFEQSREPSELPPPLRPTTGTMFEQNREPHHHPQIQQHTSNLKVEQNREPSHHPSPPRPTSNIIFEQNREPPHLPSPPRPTSNVFFEQGREPPQLPSSSQPTAMFEQSREPSELPPPPRPTSDTMFEENRGPHHPPPPQPHTSNLMFEQNVGSPHHRPHVSNPIQPRPHTQMLHERPENSNRFEDDNDEEEFVRQPLAPYHYASIKFGTAYSDDDDDDEEEEEPIKPETPLRQPHTQTNINNFELPGSQMNHFGGNPDAPLQYLSPRPPAQSPTGFRDRPVQLPLEKELPPLKHNPNPLSNVEIVEQHSAPPSHGNHNGLEIRNQHRPSNEAQLPIIQHQLPSQEPVPHGVPHNPVPTRTVTYEIRDGELQPPNYEIPDGSNEIQKPPVNFPQNPRQQEQRHHQFPIQQQQNTNSHLAELPMNSQQSSRPPQMQQRPQVINHFPKDEKVENSLHSEGNIPNNHHLPNPNILVQIEGRPHETTPINLGNNVQKPNDRPGGHMFFEKEPGLNFQPQSTHPRHPSALLRLKNVKLESHNRHNQGPNIREPVTTKPMHFPQPPQIKFPEGNLPGFAERPTPRPGQFGPPPPSQQSLPQYVPFSGNGERPKMNESDRPIPPPLQNRPMPHTSYSNPGIFRGTQSPPQYNQNNLRPQAQPPRQHGYMNQPSQPYSPNRRPPPPQMMMPGFNKGQFGNNQFYHQQQQRLRNPYSRTSRAANLTAEEEKANANEPLLSTLSSNDEQESFSDQQAILFAQTPQESSNKHQPQTLTSEGSTEEQQVEHKENAEASQFTPEMRREDGTSTSDSSHRLTPLEKKNVDSTSENKHDSPLSNKQKRELTIAGISRSQQEQRDGASLVMPTHLDDGDDLVAEESVKVDKTQLPRDIVESGNGEAISLSHPSSSHIHSPGFNIKMDEEKGNEEVLQSPEMKNKDKSEISLKDEEKERSNPSVSKSSENKKSYIKAKNMNPNVNSQEKNEDIHHQNYRKMKGKGMGEKEQEKAHHHQTQSDKTSSINPDETQEQQEFVAPTLIQRGFFPILPYSEKDPGPVVVQVPPKIEKFLPPQQSSAITQNPNINSESVGAHSFQILPSTQQIKSKPITTSPSSSIPSSSLGHADDSKALFLSNQLNNNNQLAVLQTNTLENNQTPFKTLTSNYLT